MILQENDLDGRTGQSLQYTYDAMYSRGHDDWNPKNSESCTQDEKKFQMTAASLQRPCKGRRPKAQWRKPWEKGWRKYSSPESGDRKKTVDRQKTLYVNQILN